MLYGNFINSCFLNADVLNEVIFENLGVSCFQFHLSLCCFRNHVFMKNDLTFCDSETMCSPLIKLEAQKQQDLMVNGPTKAVLQPRNHNSPTGITKSAVSALELNRPVAKVTSTHSDHLPRNLNLPVENEGSKNSN